MTPIEAQAILAAKLARISGKTEYVQKKGWNQAQGYKYAMEADFIDLVKPLLAEERVAFLPVFIVADIFEGQTKSGTATCRATVLCKITFVCGDTGATLTVQSIGQGIDSGDKSFYKSMTGAIKYALSKTFLIPTGDDPEVDENVPEPAPAATPAPKAPAPIDKQKWIAACVKSTREPGHDARMVKACEHFPEIIPMASWTDIFDTLRTDEERRSFYKKLMEPA